MSIERYGNERTLACDVCGDETERYHHDDFGMMIAAAKDAGWTIRQNASGEYEHTCPDCPEESALDRARRMFGQ